MNKHQQRSEETRTRILEAAEINFAQYGYDGAAVEQICRSAGVSKGAFYHHFDSKQAVFLALLNRWLDLMDVQIDLLGQQATTVPERLLAMTAIMSQLLQVPDQQLLIYLEFLNKAAREPGLWHSTIQPYHRYRASISRLIEAGMAEGSLRPVDPQAAASILVALAIGLLIQGFLDPEGPDWQAITQEGMRIVFSGLMR